MAKLGESPASITAGEAPGKLGEVQVAAAVEQVLGAAFRDSSVGQATHGLAGGAAMMMGDEGDVCALCFVLCVLCCHAVPRHGRGGVCWRGRACGIVGVDGNVTLCTCTFRIIAVCLHLVCSC